MSSDPSSAKPSVVVAVLTYRRPEDLAEVLPQLEQQAAEVVATGLATVEVLVVDNDPDAGAREGVTGLARYVHEPSPGIAAARNRALDEAAAQDLLIFIDDDERPVPGWLRMLLDSFRTSSASGVVGPVVSSFAQELDPWVTAGRFFVRRRMPTGTPVTVAATNNLLLDLSAVRASGLRFDDRLGLAGGSDTLFTRGLVAAAGPMVWCDEAVVHDVVPAARATRGWVLRRQLRSGNSWSRTALLLTGSTADRVRLRASLTASGAIRMLAGAGRWAWGTLSRDVRHRANGARTAARGTGMLLGAHGYGYVEYRRPAASSPAVASVRST